MIYFVFRYLVKRGVKTTGRDPSTDRDLFCWACYLNASDQAMFVLTEQQGELDLCYLDMTGYCPLHYVTQHCNTHLLDAMCTCCHKYGIGVDVRDREGYTPYMYARRMGRDDMADILEKAMASRGRCDDKFFRDGRHWERVGAVERKEEEEKYRGQKIGAYKALGRLPQLKAAHYQVDDVKIVSSKIDKQLLNKLYHSVENSNDMKFIKTENEANLQLTRSENDKTTQFLEHNNMEFLTSNAVKSSSKALRGRRRSKSLPPLRSKPKKREGGLVNMSSSQQEALLMLRMRGTGRDGQCSVWDTGTCPSVLAQKGNTHNMPVLMAQLAEQYTESYRPAAKDPGDQPRGGRKSFLTVARAKRRNIAASMLQRKLNKMTTKTSIRSTFNPLLDKPGTGMSMAGTTSRAEVKSP